MIRIYNTPVRLSRRIAIGCGGVPSTVNMAFLGHLETERKDLRSEEHTSELQSRLHLVCRLLLEKKNIPLPIHASIRYWSTRRNRAVMTIGFSATGSHSLATLMISPPRRSKWPALASVSACQSSS